MTTKQHGIKAIDGSDYVTITNGQGTEITSFGGGTEYTEGDTDATITGTAILWEDASNTLTTVNASKGLPVNIVAGTAGATEYTEDAAAAANPVGGMLIVRRKDTLSAAEVTTDGDNIAVNATAKGEVYVTISPTAANPAKAEDVAAVDADVGIPAMAVRKASPANTSNSDGDYEMLQMSAGRLWVDPSGVSLTVGTHAVTVASGGVASGAIASGAIASGAVASGAFASGSIGSGAIASGAIAAGAIAAGATSIAENEDVASGDGDRGVKVLAVQKATPVNTAGTDGDYEFLQISAGKLWVHNIGDFVTVSTDVTRPADTNVYAVNDAWSDSTSAPTSGGFTFTNAARISGGAGVITDAIITTSADASTLLQGEVWIFDTSVTNINDNAAFAVSDSEIKTYVGKIPFSMEDAGNNGSYHATGLNIGFTAIGSANLRFLVRVTNAYTPASSEVLTVRLKIMQAN